MKKKLIVKVESDETFNVNVTSTLLELFKQVKDNWTKDFYTTGQVNSSSSVDDKLNFRRRSPFIPFALKNETGSPLKFVTHISDDNNSNSPVVFKPLDHWLTVNPGDTVPFTFRTRGETILTFIHTFFRFLLVSSVSSSFFSFFRFFKFP